MFFFLVVAKFLLLFITPFFDTSVRSLAGSLISLSKPLEFSLLNWPNEKYSALGIGGWSRRLTRLKFWDRTCHVKARHKHLFFSKVQFSDWHRILDLVRTLTFWISFLAFRAHGTFKLFVCFRHKSRSATPDTFWDSAKTFSDIAIYASVLNCVFGR